jgi:two-component system response regulator HydG
LVRKLTGEKAQWRYGQLLGRHASMRKLFEKMARVSQNLYPVLIQGESGTGKEMVARSIHESGPRSRGPFLPVDCGALVPTLIESELFGHVRGAFTGASQTKQGLLEVAQGGTVFLDEIGELPLDLQAKLLRALQEKEIRPVGGTRCIHIDVRIIAATNRDLEHGVEQGTFRKDLYFRLNVVRLRVPPLRERKTDIPLLIDHFLERFTVPGGPRPAFSERALRQLLAHDWPGNIRELENCVERAVALGSGPVLDSADLASNVQNPRPLPLPVPWAGSADPAFTGPENIVPLAELERRAIFQAIADAGGDKILAARLLGIGKTTLYRKLKEYKQAV